MHADQTLLFLILILVAARLGGEIAVRLRQPAVLGEILAGVTLGMIPAIRMAADQQTTMFQIMLFVAEIGVILLLFEVGLESEFDEFLKVGAPAALVAVTGVVLPLFVGMAGAKFLGYSTNVALFLGGTLTATSVGITAKVLGELRQSQSKEAKIIIGAAVVDDILGLLVLSVVLGIATGKGISGGEIVRMLTLAVLFLVGAILIGIRSAPFLIKLTQRMKGRGVLAVSAFTFGLLLAYSGSLIGIAPIVGAFAAGLVLASTADRVKITEGIQPVVDIFAPVFFTVVGIQVNLMLLNPTDSASWPFLGLAGVLLLIAVPTKLIAGVGAIGRRVDKVAVGIGMVPRGEVGLIFASLGRSAGVLSEGVYGAVILVVLATTLITPPWLKQRMSGGGRRRRRRVPAKPEEHQESGEK